MNRYYKPTKEEFVEGLALEIYDPDDNTWLNHTLSFSSSSSLLPALEAGDIRVKYLNSQVFNELGAVIEKPLLRTQEVLLDVLLDGVEVMGTEDIHDEENLTIFHNSIKLGIFKPYAPFNNVIIDGKEHSIKNLSELRKILK